MCRSLCQTISLHRNCLKIDNDISINSCEGKVAALTMLDLSTEFETTHQESLIRCLLTWYGISGPAVR